MATKRKRKNPNTPRHWRMNRQQRLESAKAWLSTYEGKNVVKGYRKRFHVDMLCAIHELQMLGSEFKSDYIDAVKASLAASQRRKREKKNAKAEKEFDDIIECDEYFAYIEGYTSGGFPYGLTWEQWHEMEAENEME